MEIAPETSRERAIAELNFAWTASLHGTDFQKPHEVARRAAIRADLNRLYHPEKPWTVRRVSDGVVWSECRYATPAEAARGVEQAASAGIALEIFRDGPVAADLAEAA